MAFAVNHRTRRGAQGVGVMSAEEEIRTNHTSAEAEREPELAQIREALRGLRFGAVNIIVQDGVVVQIDRTEKRRVRGLDRQ